MRFRLSSAGLGLALIAVFAVANRGAFRGYFDDDELDNLAWTSFSGIETFRDGIIDPRVSPHNFRPVGHFAFWVAARTAKLDYHWYIVFIQVVHVSNACLLWLILRRLRIDPLPAAAAAFFFLTHMALFEAFWKPNFLFDLLCGTFSLLTLLFWLNGRWILSILAFWLAYKSKEAAVMLPAMLLLYEMSAGKREWKRLIPHLAISASFGLQAMFAFRDAPPSPYKLHFTLDALLQCVRFYEPWVLLFPFGSVLLLAAAVWLRDRTAWWGLLSAPLILTPMLFLPGRLVPVYLYVAMIGVAVVIARLAAKARPPLLLAFFAAWLVWDYQTLRRLQRVELADASERRIYVEMLDRFLRSSPSVDAIMADGGPPSLGFWGIEGAAKFITRRFDLTVLPLRTTEDLDQVRKPGGAVLSWDQSDNRLHPAAYGDSSEVWRLGPGWYALEAGFRWTMERAEAIVAPAKGVLNVEVNANRPSRFDVVWAGRSLGAVDIAQTGMHTLRWTVPDLPPAPQKIEFVSSPTFVAPDGRTLGIAIVRFWQSPGD